MSEPSKVDWKLKAKAVVKLNKYVYFRYFKLMYKLAFSDVIFQEYSKLVARSTRHRQISDKWQ